MVRTIIKSSFGLYFAVSVLQSFFGDGPSRQIAVKPAAGATDTTLIPQSRAVLATVTEDEFGLAANFGFASPGIGD